MPQPRGPVMLIELLDPNTVAIKGPLGDKVLCYGMLGLARKALDDYNHADKPRVVLPREQELAAIRAEREKRERAKDGPKPEGS